MSRPRANFAMPANYCRICYESIADDARVTVCENNHYAHCRCHITNVTTQIMRYSEAMSAEKLLRCEICRKSMVVRIADCNVNVDEEETAIAHIHTITGVIHRRIARDKAEIDAIRRTTAVMQATIDRIHARFN